MLDMFGLPQSILLELKGLGSMVGFSFFISGGFLFCTQFVIGHFGHGVWRGIPASIMSNEYKWFLSLFAISILFLLMLPPMQDQTTASIPAAPHASSKGSVPTHTPEQSTIPLVVNATCEMTSRTPKELIDMKWDDREHPLTCVRVEGVVQSISGVRFDGSGPIVTGHIVIDVSVGIDNDGSVQMAKVFVPRQDKAQVDTIHIGDQLTVTGMIYDVYPTHIEVSVDEIN